MNPHTNASPIGFSYASDGRARSCGATWCRRRSVFSECRSPRTSVPSAPSYPSSDTKYMGDMS
jgi:hypothetical protein